MQQSSKINEYLKTVCDQIRWKKAHDIISEEIGNHIVDQIDALMADGLDEETATDKAIKEMGDPILVGSELDRVHRPKVEWSIIILTGSILLIGFTIRIFIAYDTGMKLTLSSSIISTILGIACMALAYFLDFTFIGKYSKIIYFSLTISIIGIMMASPATNGRYFYAQFILLLFPTAFAGIIYNMISRGYIGILLCDVLFAVPGFMGIIIPSISGVILYSLTCLVLLTIVIAKGWFNVKKLNAMLLVYLPILIVAIIVSIVKILNHPYLKQRLQIALDPSIDPMGAGYLTGLTRNIVANAKFLGQGEIEIITPSNQILPNINNDFVLTYMIHRLGWVSFIVIMAALLTFIIRGLMLCSRQKSLLGRLVSLSVLITFTIEVALYVVNNLGFQLISPLTLPFISYGGISTIINMILIGIMLSVFKSDNLIRDNHKTPGGKGQLIKMFKINN